MCSCSGQELKRWSNTSYMKWKQSGRGGEKEEDGSSTRPVKRRLRKKRGRHLGKDNAAIIGVLQQPSGSLKIGQDRQIIALKVHTTTLNPNNSSTKNIPHHQHNLLCLINPLKHIGTLKASTCYHYL